MANEALSSSGTLLAVSAALPATYDSAGYAALTWTNVFGVVDIPSYGSNKEVMTITYLADAITQKAGGPVDMGAVNVQMGYLETDPGQNILQAAALPSAANIACRVTYPSGKRDYFVALVSTYLKNISGAASFQLAESMLNITTAIVEV